MTQRGWCVPNMAAQPNGQPIYKKTTPTRVEQAACALQGWFGRTHAKISAEPALISPRV